MKMKPSMTLLKMIMKLLILLILLVCLFLISIFLYSVRYWPDVYKYINANITIEHIPKISEIEIDIIELNIDYTTEIYLTTDVEYYELSTTDDFDIDEFLKDDFEIKTKVKRNIMVEEMKDYKELPSRGIFVDYVFLEGPIETNQETLENPKNAVTEKSIHNFNTNPNTVKTNTEDGHNTAKEKDDDTEKHSTTKEGYLVGDEMNSVGDDNTELFIDITTAFTEVTVEDTTIMMKDLIDMSKLTTRSLDVEMVSEKLNDKTAGTVCISDSCKNFTKTVFPWVATIFIKNNNLINQYHYTCDATILSDSVLLTTGQCVARLNETIDPENVIVFLGKGNLQSVGENEKIRKVSEITIHPNFMIDSDGKPVHNLAIVILNEPAKFDASVQNACIHYNNSDPVEEAGTTGWASNGELLPIFFEKNKREICFDRSADVFCSTYELKVALCPSFGGFYATKRDSRWCLDGIYYGDPEGGVCIGRNVLYTSLKKYTTWIDDTIVHKYIL